jgi:hypothetical protein
MVDASKRTNGLPDSVAWRAEPSPAHSLLLCSAPQDGTEKARKVFVSVPTEVGQTEAEEIGVEHLLRNVKVCRGMLP